MKRIVVLDTEVLIIAAGGDTNLERGKERALQMIAHHAGQGESIYIPAPALAECCHRVEASILALLRVASFDARAALIANRLIPAVRKAANTISDGMHRPTRESLKVDAMILATAEAIGADLFYVGEDTWFATTADDLRAINDPLRVEIRLLPPFEPQPQELPIGD